VKDAIPGWFQAHPIQKISGHNLPQLGVTRPMIDDKTLVTGVSYSEDDKTIPPDSVAQNLKDSATGTGQRTSVSAASVQRERIGRYEIRRLLGSGGMGVVYLGFDPLIQREAAIKVLSDSIGNDPSIKARFFAEARAAGKLNHPHTVGVYEIAEDNGLLFMAMEYLTGGNLAEEISRRGALPPLDATRVIADATRGVAAAHAAELIHRDIKPANLIRTTDGLVKVADFGLAKGNFGGMQLTQVGGVIGTPYYMSPEQCQSGIVDARSDVYSLGATYYNLLTGESPYQSAGSTMQVMFAHCQSPPPDPRSVNQSIPDACAKIVQRATAKKPEDRYQSANEMLSDLESVIGSLSGINPVHASRGIENVLVQESTSNQKLPSITGDTVTDSRHRSGWRWWSGMTVLALAICAGLVVEYKRFNDRSKGVDDNSSPQVQQTIATAAAPAIAVPRGEPLRVGVLHSLSGTMAISESPVVDAVQLAISEINAEGGLLGRLVETTIADGQSNEDVFVREARHLLDQVKVCTVFGCWTSSSRKAVVPLFESANNLLIYPLQYEGLEESPNVFYTGDAPNQQIMPAITWAVTELGVTQFFHIGSDYVFQRAAGEIIKDHLRQVGGELVGEAYLQLGSSDVEEAVKMIVATRPQMILNTINGDTNVAFFRALRKAGFTPANLPTVSFSIGEEEMRHMRANEMAGDYSAWSYFQSIETPENTIFVKAFKDRYGTQRVLTDPMEAAYVGVKLWAQAVREAATDNPAEIRRSLRHQRMLAPGGPVRIDPSSQHLVRSPRIGRIKSNGQFDVIWTSPEPVIPQPFPGTRTTAQWKEFLIDLKNSWGGKWSAPTNE
jgi:urea transport system substrate-binding protein